VEQPRGRIHATILALGIDCKHNHPAKLTLMVVSAHACDYCGMAWPGVRKLCEETGMGATAVRGALDWLVKEGHLEVRAYAHGGRGRSTEYIILPRIRELSTAPCGKCQFHQANPSRGEGFGKDVTRKPTATRGVSAKPTARKAKTHRTGGDQLTREHQLTTGADLAEKPGSGAATPPSSDPPPIPTTAAEARAAVNAMVDGLGATMRLKSPSQGNSGAQGGLTERTSAVPRKGSVI
jgi:hypothetical protein